jgi:hypothetical protein
LPVKILHDPHDVIKGLLQSSARLRFEVMEDDVDYSISKGLAAALEAFGAHNGENYCLLKRCSTSCAITSCRQTIGSSTGRRKTRSMLSSTSEAVESVWVRCAHRSVSMTAELSMPHLLLYRGFIDGKLFSYAISLLCPGFWNMTWLR